MAMQNPLRKVRNRSTSTANSVRRPLSRSTRLLRENASSLPDALQEISRLSRLARLGAAWNESGDEERG